MGADAPLNIGLITLAIVLVAWLAETVLYLTLFGPYWRFGPPLSREEWQTSVSSVDAHAALQRALHASQLVARVRGPTYCFRRRLQDVSFWPRAALYVVDSPNGAILTYEVRPTATMTLFTVWLLGVVLFNATWFLPFVLAIVIALLYAYYWKRELRFFDRLRPVRHELRSIGLLVCDYCGYDLHRREEGDPCPECGRVSGRSVADPGTSSPPI